MAHGHIDGFIKISTFRDFMFNWNRSPWIQSIFCHRSSQINLFQYDLRREKILKSNHHIRTTFGDRNWGFYKICSFYAKTLEWTWSPLDPTRLHHKIRCLVEQLSAQLFSSSFLIFYLANAELSTVSWIFCYDLLVAQIVSILFEWLHHPASTATLHGRSLNVQIGSLAVEFGRWLDVQWTSKCRVIWRRNLDVQFST